MLGSQDPWVIFQQRLNDPIDYPSSVPQVTGPSSSHLTSHGWWGFCSPGTSGGRSVPTAGDLLVVITGVLDERDVFG